ncbi:MAG TPA: phage holin family protein [Acidimicrobiia bacterium]|nr:phage holin family protein [Acidimicrobiia bacterium]
MSDWTTQVADTVDTVVDFARERAVEPAQALGRGIVYGLLAAFFLVTALTLAAIGTFRVLSVYLPEDVWVAHFTVGGIFILAGLFSWSRRKAR